MLLNAPTIHDVLFSDKIKCNASDMALCDESTSISWPQLRERCISLAVAMKDTLGLGEHQHVALLIGNRAEFIESMLAGIIAGLWITPVNTHLNSDEVSYIISDSGAKALFYDDQHAHLIEGYLQGNQQACECINIEEFCLAIYQKLKNENSEKIESCFPLSGAAGGTMLYTSGTTGKPKGVKRNKPGSLGEAMKRMQSGGKMFGLEGRGPHLVTGPLYHAAPMLFALYDLLNGAPMVIMPKWNNQLFVDLVIQHGVTTTHLVPTMFVRLLNDNEIIEKQTDFSTLQLVLHGAAPIAKSTKQKMLHWWGNILVEYWGGTEAGVTTLVTSEQWLEHPGTVGKPLPHFDVYVGDDTGNPVDDSSMTDSSKDAKNESPLEGLLFCRHHQLYQVFEYHHDDKKTQLSHPQPYIFCIGDIGYVVDGFVYLSDRQSNMIISGGVNIYPAETEQALSEHEAIADVAVFGVPSDEWGEDVKAAIQLKSGFEPSKALAESIIEFSREKVATYKAPKSIDFESQLPRTPTGKLLVRLLKEKYQ
ncbi:MAG: AMP-binding protein [Pseudomonadales bacterium]|nr:AMP-binding protein [Pseudomonadales bacterium]